MQPSIEEESRWFEAGLRRIAHLEGQEQEVALSHVGAVLERLGCAPEEIDGILRRLVRPDALIEMEVGEDVTELRVVLPEDMC